MLKLPSSRRAPAATWTNLVWLFLAEELFSINFSSFVIWLLGYRLIMFLSLTSSRAILWDGIPPVTERLSCLVESCQVGLARSQVLQTLHRQHRQALQPEHFYPHRSRESGGDILLG